VIFPRLTHTRKALDTARVWLREHGNNRDACFHADEDYLFYLVSLDDAYAKYDREIVENHLN